MSCPVCNHAATPPRLVVRGTPILGCARCGLQFWRPAEGFRAADTYHGGYFADPDAPQGYDDYASLEPALRQTFARRLARLGPPQPGMRMLDLGAAYGFAIDEARRLGWRACGLEISAAAARHAAGLNPGAVMVGDATRLPLPPDRFDVVTLWDVIEHLPDPHRLAAELARVMRPGGRLLLTTGDASSWLARLSGPHWHLYTLPEHLFFFTRRSLTELLASHGFEILSLRHESARYPLHYLAERIGKTLAQKPLRSRIGRRFAQLQLSVNLFDIFLLDARLRTDAPRPRS